MPGKRFKLNIQLSNSRHTSLEEYDTEAITSEKTVLEMLQYRPMKRNGLKLEIKLCYHNHVCVVPYTDICAQCFH